MVKNEKLNAYFKSKGFYISLLAGIAAVLVICFVYFNYGVTNKNNNNLTDLNEPFAENDANPGNAENIINSADNTGIQQPVNDADQQMAQADPENLLENDIYDENNTNDIVAMAGDEQDAGAQTQDTAQTEPETVPVMNADGKVNKSLSFDEENGLLWPVTGDVIMNYSMSRGIYFQTLGQYKCNPAIIISCEPGTEVFSAADAVIKEIYEDPETGLTVKALIGGDYELVYGQLKDLNVKEGDSIKEGELIGLIAEPTKYYVTEGSNLYFQVLENEESVNPLLLLR